MTALPPEEIGSAHVALARDYVQARRDLKATEKAVDMIKDRVASLAESLASAFAMDGVQSVKAAGSTVYLATEMHCSPRAGADLDSALSAVAAEGLSDLISVKRTANLGAWFRERVKQFGRRPTDDEFAELLPPALRPFFEPRRFVEARVRGL